MVFPDCPSISTLFLNFQALWASLWWSCVERDYFGEWNAEICERSSDYLSEYVKDNQNWEKEENAQIWILRIAQPR